MIRWSEVTALFGGTFDPPHLGHREAVCGLFSYPGAKRVFVLPTAIPPHKPTHTPFEHRLSMVRLNFSKTLLDAFPPAVEIHLAEIERASQKAANKSYTFDTLTQLRREIAPLAWVIGADQLYDLPSWYRFPEILGLSHWIVLARKPLGLESSYKTLSEWEASGLAKKATSGGHELGGTTLWALPRFGTFITVVPTLAPALSSSKIRQSIERTGIVPVGALLPEVEAYLKANHLYGI